MTEQEQRIAIAEACGFSGCTDSKCDYRKCQHLHNKGIVYFPEPYSTPCYPDYLHDLNAMHEAEKVLNDGQAVSYGSELDKLTVNHNYYWHATAAQRAEAFLRTIGKWKEAE